MLFTVVKSSCTNGDLNLMDLHALLVNALLEFCHLRLKCILHILILGDDLGMNHSIFLCHLHEELTQILRIQSHLHGMSRFKILYPYIGYNLFDHIPGLSRCVGMHRILRTNLCIKRNLSPTRFYIGDMARILKATRQVLF